MILNRSFWVLMMMVVFMAACSPKIRMPKPPATPKEDKEKNDQKAVKKLTEANLSLLIPFRLNSINLKTLTKAEVEKYAMPIDFYQGFRMGVDSAAAVSGLNFKLNVFDTQDNNAQIARLYQNDNFKNSNLIIGPVFPEGLKFISSWSKEHHAAIVSPLAASNPTEFNNPNLISVVNNIELHAQKIGVYIKDNFNPANTIVVLINPKKSEDEAFAAPIRAYFRGKTKFVMQEYASAFTFETKMIRGKQYVVMLTSADRAFVLPTIEKLYKLKNLKSGGYAINLFGHPNWVKQNYPTEKLQALNAIISSSYKIDYKHPNVIAFIKKYRYQFGFEPGEYAFKGFDVGFYFSRLLSKYGDSYLDYLTREKYEGLHNHFSFIHDDQLGYLNTSLMLLKYQNYSLALVN